MNNSDNPVRYDLVTAVEPPPMVLAWITQLLDPTFVEVLKTVPYDRVDIRLQASRGKVSRLPAIVFNCGQAEMIEP